MTGVLDKTIKNVIKNGVKTILHLCPRLPLDAIRSINSFFPCL